jgi:arylsulfatase A-like enzyme
MVGKWHIGIGEKAFWPNARGYDYHYGFIGGWVDFYTHVYADGLDWIRNGVVVEEEGHATDLFTADAQRVIQSRDKDEPFLLYLAYNAPHTPLQNVPHNSGLNDDVDEGDRGVYAEMATHVDAGIGQVIETLKAEGILDNTILVFSSDNGGQVRAGASNGDLRGSKGGAFEGGMRVPGLIWWPRHVDGGGVFEQPIAVHDWLPTLLEAVGGDAASVKNAYGQSMWAALADNKKLNRKPVVIGVKNAYAAIDWPWKYVQFMEGRGSNAKKAYGLFNVLEDPEEKTDLSAQYPEKVATLKVMLDARPAAESISEKTRDHAAASFYLSDPETGLDFDERLEATSIPWAERAKK